MNDQELRATLINELGIGDLPEEARDEIVSKLGEIVLKSVTVTIFEQLPEDARKEFDELSLSGDQARIGAFLARTIPDMENLMQEEMKKVLTAFREGEQLIGE